MKFTIDRIEGDQAVIELADKRTLAVPLALFEDRPVEGDIYRLEKDSTGTEQKRAEMQNRFDRLKKKK